MVSRRENLSRRTSSQTFAGQSVRCPMVSLTWVVRIWDNFDLNSLVLAGFPHFRETQRVEPWRIREEISSHTGRRGEAARVFGFRFSVFGFRRTGPGTASPAPTSTSRRFERESNPAQGRWAGGVGRGEGGVQPAKTDIDESSRLQATWEADSRFPKGSS